MIETEEMESAGDRDDSYIKWGPGVGADAEWGEVGLIQKSS